MKYLVLKQPPASGSIIPSANRAELFRQLFVFLVLLLPGLVKAQHRDSFPSVISGLSSNPIIGSQAFNATESIYMNYEIGSNNFTTPATAIRRIAYNVNFLSGPVTVTSGNFKIYMKNVPITDTIYSNTCCYSTSGYTMVYNGPLSITDTGILNINLTTPFVRTSGTNLMVLSERTDSVIRGSNIPQFRCSNGTVTNLNRVTNRRYNSSARPASGVTVFQLSNFRPAAMFSGEAQAVPYIVGTSEVYTSLTNNGGLFQALASNPLTQNTTVTITSDLSETGTHKLTGAALNGFSLTIKSSTNTTRVISCLNSAFPMITIDSAVASSVTFDGAINGSGQYLRFVSTNTTQSSGRQAFLITKGSRVNIYNCIIEGNSTSPVSYGLVQIASGNNQFTMRTCDVRAAIGSPGTAGTPSNLIYSASSGNRITIGGDSVHHGNRLYGFANEGINLFQVADSVLIRFNHVYQNGSFATSTHSYIRIASGNAHNVSDNAIYQSSGTSNGNMNGISIQTSTGNGHIIRNNSIGGANENRTGAAMSYTNNGERNGISVVVSNNGFTSIQGNRISNMASPIIGTLNGIRASGNVRIGTEIGNTIGGGNLPSDTMSTAYDNGGIIIYGSDTAIIENNTIGNFSFWNSSTGRMTGITSFQGAYVRIHNNTIRDFNSYNNDQGATFFPAGIALLNGAKAGSVIDSNFVFNINRQIPTSGSVNNSFAAGIYTKGTATSLSITNNTIYNIRNFSTISGTNAGRAIGLFIDGANNNNVTVSNNQIALNNNSGNEALVYGILEIATGTNSPTNRYFYNSVFVGGSMSGGSNSSYAFYRDATHSQITLKNNILFNQRTGGTGYGYALGIKASTNFNPGISNFNALVSVLDSFKVDYLNVPYGINGFITSSLNDSNSVALNATTHTAASFFTDISTGNLSVQSGKRNLVAGKGTPIVAVTVDIGGTNRSTSTPTIGAFEYTSTATPTITASGTLTAFSACAGTASAQQSFTVGGTNLTANIIITPPTGYEVSTTSGSGFSSSVTLTQSSGTVASTTIYVRLTSSASGTPSGNITCASTGATSQNVSASGTVNALPTITLGSISAVLTTATSFNLPYTATTGSPNQYSILSGTPTAMPSFSAVNNASLGSSPIAVTIPASTANTYNFKLVVYNTTTGCASDTVPFSLTVNSPASPAINVSGSLTAFSTCAGTASTQQSFTVGGTNLTANITITPPTGYEVSTTSGSGFTSSVSLTPSSGTVASTTIYVRLASSATGAPSGNIVSSSTGATSQNVSASGTVNDLPTATLGSASSVSPTATSFSLPYSAAVGSPNQYSIAVGTPTAMSGFTPVTNAILGSSPIAVTIPASAVGNYNFNITLRNTTTGCVGAALPFTVSVLSGDVPNTISGLRLWLDGSDVNANGTTPTANSSVSQWSDKSGLSNHAQVLLGQSSGTFVPNQINGKSVIRFNRTTTLLGSVYNVPNLDFRASNLPQTTIFTVYKPGTSPASAPFDQAIWGIDNGGWDRFFFTSFPGLPGPIQNGGVANGTFVVPIPNSGVVGQTRLLTAVYDHTVNNGSAVYFNGNLVAPFTDNTDANAAFTNLRIGFDGDDNTYNGDIAEMLVYNRKLSICEIQTINRYLATKYGVEFTTVRIDTSGPTSFVQGGSVTLSTPTSGTSYQWLRNGVAISGAGTSSYVATLAGNYRVVVNNGCSDTSAVRTVTLLPSISTVGSLTAFSTCAGTASAQQSFSVSGANLNTDITVIPPSGFEVSTTSGSGFTSSVTLTPSSGTVASTTIYVRLASSATGNPSGNITASSTGATSQTVAANGTVNTIPTINLGSVSSVFTTATSFNLPFTSVVGSPNQYSITTGSPTAMPSFSSVTNATLSASPIAVTIPASAANTYNFNITVRNSTTGCVSSNVPFTLTVANPSISNNTISSSQLICSGTAPAGLVGSTPIGGNNTFAYTWLRSTTSATGGFSAATGTNNQQNYLPPSLTQNTWFRRLVSSAGSSDTSAAVLITVGDTTKPIARPRNMVAYLNSAGTLNLTGSQVDSASFDNCDIQSRTLSRSSFNCTQIGSNQIYLIITDANGNKDSALATITVLDTVAPNAIAQNRTLYLNAIGSATLTASQVNNGSTDACGIATLGINKTSFNCSNLGSNTVTLTVTDVNGNAKTANATITVLDTIKPTVSVNSGLVLYLNAQGTLGISASQFVSGSNDNCGIVSTTLNPSNINCSHLGITPVTVTVTDAAGNKDSATTNAIVLDPIAPVARPKARLTIYLSGNGQAVINPTLLDSASTDNCSITSKVLSQSVFNCNNIGTNNVTFTVQDQSGNSNAANVIVTVLDTISPVATVSNQLVYLNNSGTGSITAAQVNNNSTDNCGIQSVSINKNTFNCSDLGTRTIQFTATDLNGNSRTVPVIVNVFDTIRPVIRPKRNVNIYLNASGNATLTLAMADSASTDNCSMGGRNLSQTTFTCANLGANTVTLNGTDSTGNIGQATFTVTVIDTITPALTSKPATVYLNNTGTATLTASQVIQSSSDNCGSATASLNTSSFTCANLGNNTVNITLTDASNNNRVVSATVTVVDTLKPNAIAQNRTIYLNAAGLATITAAQVDNGSTDNCTISNRSISKSSFTAADLGSNLITLTITDNSNNGSQTQALITVLDTVRPVVQTQNRTIYLNSAGTATVTAAQVNNGSTDNVGITGLQLSKTLFTCTDLGSNQVFLTATDISNNSSSLAATITVLDTIKPVVNSQNVTLFLNGIGQATLTTAAANNGSTDNCSVASLTLSKTLFTCNDRGVNTIQLNAIDASSNMATGNLQVTVVDTTRPNVVVNNNLTLYLNSSGTASLTTAMVNNGSTDNCGIVSQTLTKTSFNGTNLGLNLVTYTIADASNNQNSVVLNITVLDTMRPVLNAQNRTIYLDASGNATLTTAMVNNGSTDNVGIAQMQLSKTSFNCSNIGSNQVTFSIIDASLNQTSTLVTITVLDTIKPLAAAQNLTVYLNAAGIATITTAQANNGSADNCGTANLTLSKQTFGCTDRGNNSVTLTVTDGSNNSSTVNFNVTVLDTIKPVILANPIVLLYLDNTGNATLTTGMVNLGSYDNCNSVNLTLSKTSFNGTNLGANQVTLTVADPSNNQSTATIVVNVIDTIRPIVKAKDLTLYLNSGGSVFLTPAEVNDGSTDNVGISFTGISKSLFTCNETGTNLVEFAAQDITGNRSTKWVTITVLDTIQPIVSSFPSSVVLGHCNQDYQFSPPFASDNCGLVTTVQTSGIPNGKKYPIGTTTNTFTFTDRSGNVVTRSFTVTILPAYLPDTFPNRTACSSEPPFDLTRGNLNVEFSGGGVTLDGLQFDPRLAGPGNHAVICTFTDTTGCETKTTFFVTVYRSPDKPVIERMNSDVLQVFQTYDFYQWRRNGEDIPGANQRAYTMTKTGIYSVRVGTVAGCTTESDLLGVGVALGVDEDSKLLFNLFPNPTQSNFRVDVNTSGSKEFTIKIFDAVGKLVYESVEKGFSAEIDTSEWRAGTYMVHIQSDNKSAVKPVILTK